MCVVSEWRSRMTRYPYIYLDGWLTEMAFRNKQARVKPLIIPRPISFIIDVESRFTQRCMAFEQLLRSGWTARYEAFLVNIAEMSKAAKLRGNYGEHH